jgi:hypothetical protein
MTTPPPHSAEAEEKSLKLVEDFLDELSHALDSLGDKTPTVLVDTYRFWSVKHLQRAVAGFAFLRRSNYVDSSKFLVRPALEMLIRLETARQHPELFYRIAYTERLRDEQLLRESDNLMNDEQESKENWKQFKANWQRFDDAFKKEFPSVPQLKEKLDMAFAAEKAGLKPFYGGHYRIYSQYTHGALRASTGSLDAVTNPEDNRIMSVCAFGALDNLISFGAKSPNRHALVERLQQLRP